MVLCNLRVVRGCFDFSGAAHPDVITVDNLVRWSSLNGKQRDERESSFQPSVLRDGDFIGLASGSTAAHAGMKLGEKDLDAQ
jgi:hypothetical protein